ncbi:hypothetical protein COT52_02800 [candidate division WWE3 bacterium CG08_land_8_20_14_0_20_43_13]|uniref:O-antigen ligase-related domain-containing protein n=1 Tax=candidate division WWE3 bacterium CG08_land_8_20_14_0_20_43_13 TaxID=1975087 RepID=A0A2H0X6R0_UNCKA|nr:MAG: hypothetical protein COT52_02800 [candidate division WWE3 bacterium CG08_land_8_20_14_0_20_43_13]
MAKAFRLIQKVLLIGFVATLPLINTDLFSIIHPKLFPARLILVVLLLLSFLGGMRGYFLAWRKHQLPSLIKAHWAKIKSDKVLWCLMFLWLWRALSLLNSLNISASLNLLAFYTAIVGLYILLLHLYQEQRSFLKILFFLHLGVVSLIGLYGLIQIATPFFGIKLPGVLIGGTFFRIPATFYDANHLPPYLLTAIPSLLVGSWILKSGWWRRILFVLTGLLSVVLMFTFSRSGLLGFSGACFFVALVCILKGYWRKTVFFASIVLVLGALVILSSRTQYSFTKRIASSLSGNEKSTVAHGLLLFGEWKLFLSSPILGVGYGSFSEHFRASTVGQYHATVDPALEMRIPAHSSWMEALAETGLPGFLALVCLVMLLLEGSYRQALSKGDKVLQLQAAALFAGGLGIMLGAIYYSYNLEFVWFYLFLVYFFNNNHILSNKILVKNDVESVPWKEILPFSVLVLWCGFWLFWRLGDSYLLSCAEGYYSLAAKGVLRNAFVHLPRWWLPNWAGSAFSFFPPLFSWAQAFFMFFYYVTSYAARFWSAVFGLAGAVIVYFWFRYASGKWQYGVIGALFAFAAPGFISASRLATPMTGGVCLILLYGFFLYLSLNKNRLWMLTLPLVIGISSYYDWVVTLSLLLFSCLLLIFNKEKRDSFLMVIFGLSGLLFLIPWIWLACRSGLFCLGYFRDYFLRYPWGWWPWLSWLIVICAFLFSRVSLIRKRTKFGFSLSSIVALTVIISLFSALDYHYTDWEGANKYQSLIELVLSRQQTSRVGIHPNVADSEVPLPVIYYSDVPFEISSDFSILYKDRSDGTKYYAFVNGARAYEIRAKLREVKIGTKIISSYHDMVLLETW